MTNGGAFLPNWTSTPGSTIFDILHEKNLSLSGFAQSMNCDQNFISDLLNGYLIITEEVAVKLERNLGGSADFWLTRESQYREDLHRLSEINQTQWLRNFPFKEATDFGWLRESKNKLTSCLEFFNVPDLPTWEKKYHSIFSTTAFRKSEAFDTSSEAVTAWLRRGEIIGNSIECNVWDSTLFKNKLLEIKSFTRIKRPKDFIPKLKAACAECGVSLVIERTPSGCPISGATKFLTPDHPMILLSFRYRSDDHFWFTFFHEAGHLILHKDHDLFLETEDPNENKSKEEDEADDFSFNVLIPQNLQSKLRTLPLDKRNIIRFASMAGISPGILVGQLQHMGRIKYGHHNGFKRHYAWEDIF